MLLSRISHTLKVYLTQNLLTMDSLGRPTCLFRRRPNNPTIHSQVQIQVFPFIDGYNWVMISSSLAMLLTPSWCGAPWHIVGWGTFFLILKSFLPSKSQGRQFLVLVINLERKMGPKGGDRIEGPLKQPCTAFITYWNHQVTKFYQKKTCLQKKICRITELKKWINSFLGRHLAKSRSFCCDKNL